MKQFIVLFVMVVLVSCGDENIVSSQNDGYDFSNSNILTFKDGADVFSYLSENGKKSTPQFFSMNDRYEEALAKLEAAETIDDHSSILDDYKDVVQLVEDTYLPVFSNSSYRKIINQDRLYVSGGLVHKVINNEFIVFTEKKYVKDLLKIETIENLGSQFKIAPYQSMVDYSPSGRTKANCGDNLYQDYFDNHSNCRDDRRAWVHGYAYKMVSGNYYTPSALCEVYGERRTGTWCNWKSYATVLHYKNCSFTVKLAINGTTLYYPIPHSSLPDYNGTSDEVSRDIWNGAVGTAVLWGGGTPPTTQFDAIHLEGSTQGVGANDPTHWAVINCQ